MKVFVFSICSRIGNRQLEFVMKTRQLLNSTLLLCLFLSLQYAHAQQGGKLKMWYNKPATVWNEALPIGNGRLAAMIFGGPVSERIQLNESTFWSGGPSRNDNPDALGALPAIRQLIFNGMYSSAESIPWRISAESWVQGCISILLLMAPRLAEIRTGR